MTLAASMCAPEIFLGKGELCGLCPVHGMAMAAVGYHSQLKTLQGAGMVCRLSDG